MISFEVFKEKLGDAAHTMTDKEIHRLMELMDQIADALLDAWLKEPDKGRGMIAGYDERP